RTLGLGVCIATAMDPTDGRVQACPALTFLEGRTPAADLQARLGLPTSLSRLVDGLCLAETRSQPHAGAPTTCALLDLTAEPTVSLCAQGQLVPLSSGRGGGFGRIPLTPAGSSGRHLADCVSDDAFARRLDPRADHDTATLTRRLAQMASGDGFAAKDLAPLLDDLAAAAATVAHLFAPEVLVLRSRLLTAHPDGLQRVAAHVQGELGDTVTLRQAQMDPAQASLASFVYHLASALGPSVS
ncbi:MAG: hypothetical protein OER86_07575, partial [Phycisphaerae bacterium]|nr:hypothetical protein [Phycisphaerae bacterium]